jgi:hypothetical protein
VLDKERVTPTAESDPKSKCGSIIEHMFYLVKSIWLIPADCAER